MKSTILWSVFLVSLFLPAYSQLNNQQSQIEKQSSTYLNKWIHIRKGRPVDITRRGMYAMKMGQTEYSLLSDKEMQATIYNLSGPNATAGTHYSLEYCKDNKWIKVPFVDRLAFVDIGFSFSQGKTVDYTLKKDLWKEKLSSGRYRIKTDVLVELFADFEITGETPVSKRTSPMSPIGPPFAPNALGPLKLSVSSASLQKDKDSILCIISNHSDRTVYLSLYPHLLMEEQGRPLATYHPGVACSSQQCIDKLRKTTEIPGGASLELRLPLRWNVDQLNSRDRTAHKKGSLEPGHYRCRQLIGVPLSVEFELKE